MTAVTIATNESKIHVRTAVGESRGSEEKRIAIDDSSKNYSRSMSRKIVILNTVASTFHKKRGNNVASSVIRCEAEYRSLSDQEIQQRYQQLAGRASSGEDLTGLVASTFCLVREAASRILGTPHYPTQLLAGALLCRRCIVEMETGEGKTLTATLPIVVFALRGKGVLLATANDYLAKRDAETMAPLYKLLGLSTGVIQSDDSDQQRRSAYYCDITYGTASQFAFDLLRDRAKRRQNDESTAFGKPQAGFDDQQPVGRSTLHAIIVDEADNLLIDEASTPLIIASQPPPTAPEVAVRYNWASSHARDATEGEHYRYNLQTQQVELTKGGQAWLRSLGRPPEVHSIGLIETYEYMERAVKVVRDYHLEQHYVINGGQITIVDERTGRPSHGRQWQSGIHQAIQAKEGIEVTMSFGQLARVSMQSYFLAFGHLSGMTGTASQSSSEFGRVYKLGVVPVPRHYPSMRKHHSTKIARTEDEKFAMIASEVQEFLGRGRSILIGTRTIEISLRLSAFLKGRGLDHEVLNAHQTEQEAEKVAGAGQVGSVMVATNMAGRGTDIKLCDAVRSAGGLHVILTEMHDTARVDRQLIGRCARQRDPGSYRFILSLEDEILQQEFGFSHAEKLKTAAPLVAGLAMLKRAQESVTKKAVRSRLAMLKGEQERLKKLWRTGLDPLLDIVDS